jgi:haloacid dehalogenase-like hydrolase
MKRFSAILLLIVLQFGCIQHTRTVNIQPTMESALPSWMDTPAKKQIINFVTAVCDRASDKYVSKENRVAVFDVDGTLLCEKPEYIEVVVTKQRLYEKVNSNPSLADKPLYKAVLENDDKYFNEHVKEAILEAFVSENLAHLAKYWRRFVTLNNHPTLNRKYATLFYKPMIDLIVYLQKAGFSVYLVSTSQQEYIRSFCPDLLPVPKQNVLGSMVGFTLANLKENSPHTFVRSKEYFTPYNADNGKSARLRERGLHNAIFAAGNSMGDYAMLDGVSDVELPNIVLVIDHDDPLREFEYPNEGLLSAAQKRDWVVVSMKNDFRTIFKQPDTGKQR